MDVDAMSNIRERAIAAEQVRIDDRKRASVELLSVKGDPQVVLGVRSSLSAAVMGAGQCFGRAPVPAETRVPVTVSTKGATSKFRAGSVGIEAVDECFEELAEKVSLPAGKSKVRIAYVYVPE